MDVPSLGKKTGAAAQIVPQLDRDGGQALVVLIKQRFSIRPSGRVAPSDGAKIHLADQPWDEDAPEKSSIRYPADVCLRKPSTDVLVSGAAMAPGRAPAKSLDVSVKVGPVQTQLRVFGVRIWQKGLTGIGLSDPRPFEEQALRWEQAFGGFDTSDPSGPLEEPRNPVGKGLVRDPATLVNTLAPSIEDPHDLIKGPKSRPTPAGVGPLGRHWMPRRAFTGTMDERWKKERLPLLPIDFDDRYNQLAPPSLIAPAPLKGGEPVELLNLCAEGPLRLTLPRIAFNVTALSAEGKEDLRAALDTVLFEPNQRRFDMTWRVTLRNPRGKKQVKAIQVVEKVERAKG